MMVWKMIFLFQGCILRFHVNLPGCTIILGNWIAGFEGFQEVDGNEQTATAELFQAAFSFGCLLLGCPRKLVKGY